MKATHDRPAPYADIGGVLLRLGLPGSLTGHRSRSWAGKYVW